MLSDVTLGGHAARGNTLRGRRGSRYMLGILQAHTGTLSPDLCGKLSQESSRQYNWCS
jgi:hypothetical protein